MPLLVVGSIAFDSVKTPKGEVNDALGGSAVYFSYAASYFAPVRVVGVVGEDFPQPCLDLMVKRGIDVSGVRRLAGKKTFRWSGSYEGAMNEATTLDVQLNVLGEFDGKLPQNFADSRYVFLANGPPALQQSVLEQVKKPELIVADTMNHWIVNERDKVSALLKRVDGAVMNDQEIRMYTGEHNLPLAGRKVLEEGPKFIVIKKGEHGSLLVTKGEFFAVPAFPSIHVTDPTGAGDSFAGGMMGYIAKVGDTRLGTLKRAITYGTVIASINVEGFSLERFQKTVLRDVDARYEQFRQMMMF